MSHSNHIVIKTEEETTTLRRYRQPQYANPTCAVKARRMKGAALPIIKVEDTSDTDTASTMTETEGSRKRKRDVSEDESEQKPSKRRLSAEETVQLEEEEVLQSLLEGYEECDEPVKPSLEVKVEPIPEISLTLWERNASGATKRTRARAPSPPESTTQVEEQFLPVTPPWSPEPNQVASGLTTNIDEPQSSFASPGEVGAKLKSTGADEDGVLVGGRLFRITRERRRRLGLPPLEVPVVPRVVAVARKNTAATRRKPAKGRKRATK